MRRFECTRTFPSSSTTSPLPPCTPPAIGPLSIFVKADIENPSFDSQTKEYLSTPSSKFGSSCSVSDKIIDKLAKMGIMDNAIALTEIKDNKAAKKTDGKKTKNIRGIPKLLDANLAGGQKSAECTLILCEGDSAKAGIVSGLSKDDRNTIGVYPMKGKIFNVRGESLKRYLQIIELKSLKLDQLKVSLKNHPLLMIKIG